MPPSLPIYAASKDGQGEAHRGKSSVVEGRRVRAMRDSDCLCYEREQQRRDMEARVSSTMISGVHRNRGDARR